MKYKKKVEISPGPQCYKISRSSSFSARHSAVFGTTKKPELWGPSKEMPSPAAYNVKPGFIPKKVTIFLPYEKKVPQTPGVGSYDVKPVLAHSPKVRMATSKRTPSYLIPSEASLTPGPGMYSSKSSFASKPLPKVQQFQPVLKSRR